MLSNRRMFGRSMTALFGASLLLIAMASPVSATIIYETLLSGDEEVPGPGDPDADGYVRMLINAGAGEVCWVIDIVGLDEAATGLHIHEGDVGVAGPIVVPLETTFNEGLYQGCVTGQDEATLNAIVADAEGFYVNIHTATYPAGAARGQLVARAVIEEVRLGVMLCPAGYPVPTDPSEVDAAFRTCQTTGPVGEVPDPPDGYSWDPEPVELDITELDLQIVEEDGFELFVEDAEFGFRDGVCDTETFLCRSIGTFSFLDVTAGETDFSHAVIPDGYEFSWIWFVAGGEGQIAGADSPLFTTTLLEEDVEVGLYFFYNAAAAPPSQPPAPTTPPTSTGDAAASAGAASLGLSLLMFTLAAGAVLAIFVRPRRRAP